MPTTTPLDANAAASPNEVVAAAQLGAHAERSKAVPYEDVEAGLVARILTDGERIQVADLEHLMAAPRAPRGDATIYEPADFVSYVNRLATPATTLWADPDRATITAVFDDHTDGHAGGWRRHRAVLAVRPDPDWQTWVGRSGRLGGQEDFAEFVEDNYAAVVDPDPATMLEVASTFQARKSSSFERGTRLTTGDVQLRWSETTSASAGSKGHLEVPEKFTVRIAPYLGVPKVDVLARLRYRIADGNLRIGYVLHRPDVALVEAFDRIRADVMTGVTSDTHLGPAPAQLHQPERARY